MKYLEKVQRRATKIVPGIRDLPYRERLQQPKLHSLRYRRKIGDMIQTYKILDGLEDIPDNSLPKLAEDGPIRGHTLKLHKPRCRTALTQHFFSNRVIEDWNRLREKVISASSLNG